MVQLENEKEQLQLTVVVAVSTTSPLHALYFFTVVRLILTRSSPVLRFNLLLRFSCVPQLFYFICCYHFVTVIRFHLPRFLFRQLVFLTLSIWLLKFHGFVLVWLQIHVFFAVCLLYSIMRLSSSHSVVEISWVCVCLVEVIRSISV